MAGLIYLHAPTDVAHKILCRRSQLADCPNLPTNLVGNIIVQERDRTFDAGMRKLCVCVALSQQDLIEVLMKIS